MKNTFIKAALALTVLASCGGNSVEKDVQEMCDCYKTINKDGATEEETKKCLTLQGELNDKYKGDQEKYKEFNDRMSECTKEILQNSLGK